MNRVTLAVAGSRKTQSIVEECAGPDSNGSKILVITYTLTGQRDLEKRLGEACSPHGSPTVAGWYSFLLRYWIRPYLPLLYPGRRLAGLNFHGEPARGMYASGVSRFLDSRSRAYKIHLSKLAVDVASASDGKVIDRLQRLFEEIYIDEVQDLTGYDLDILELLLRSGIRIRLVGDVRQSVFDTNPRDKRNKQFRGLGMINWFVDQSDAGVLRLERSDTTWRSNQEIASFSDSIFPQSYGFHPTESKQTRVSGHDGIFVLAKRDVSVYVERFAPLCLRHARSTPTPDELVVTNFGLVKGQTHDRVLIFPTRPIAEFLLHCTELEPKSACGLYVGVTRATNSVAFVLDNPESASVQAWMP